MVYHLNTNTYLGWTEQDGAINVAHFNPNLNNPTSQVVIEGIAQTRIKIWGYIVDLNTTDPNETTVVGGYVNVGPNNVNIGSYINISRDTIEDYEITGALVLNKGWSIFFTPDTLVVPTDAELNVLISYTLE